MAANITRRELLGGAAATAAALAVDPGVFVAQTNAPRAIVFRNTTVVNPDLVQDDVALAVVGDTIAAIGPSDQIMKSYPNADVIDGRGKAIFPGLVNCHAHLTATLERGFNEDFGFPNSAQLKVRPSSLLQGDEASLMVTVGALEAIRTGTTTFVENAGGIGRYAAALAKTGLRWVFAESVRDSENVARSVVAGRPGEKRDAAFLSEAARRRHAAHQRAVQRVARQEPRSHQRVSSGGADRDLVARASEGRARVRRQERSRLHDPPESERRRASSSW